MKTSLSVLFTHTGHDWAMRHNFLIFKSRQICSYENFMKNFVRFQPLD